METENAKVTDGSSEFVLGIRMLVLAAMASNPFYNPILGKYLAKKPVSLARWFRDQFFKVHKLLYSPHSTITKPIYNIPQATDQIQEREGREFIPSSFK